MSWHEVMEQAERCRQLMVSDRPSGEASFEKLFESVGRDGMIHFKRAEAYEALGDPTLARSDYETAAALFPMQEWKTRATEGVARTVAALNRPGEVTFANLHSAIQPLARQLIAELRARSQRVVETPTNSYLAVKFRRYLICTFNPDGDGARVGYYEQPRGGAGDKWRQTSISPRQSSDDLKPLRDLLQRRLDHLVESAKTRVDRMQGELESQKLPRVIDVPVNELSRGGRYVLELEIGKGGMGIVFRGHEEADESRHVAVKFFTATNEDDTGRRRFQREVRLQATRLRHDGIVSVLGSSLEVKKPFFVMEYAAEGSLRNWLCLRTLDVAMNLKIFGTICDGVAHAHDQGIVHRDLKPENILQVAPGVWKVADFGLCVEIDRETTTLTTVNLGLGTVFYSAPEQMANAREAGPPADIYSLGVILFELVTGLSPPISAADIPEIFGGIIVKATARHPEKRFASVRDLALAVEECRRNI